MNIEQIRDAYRASPFKPFVLHLADGRNVAVDHPEFIMFSREGDEVAVYEREGRKRYVDPKSVTEIDVPRPRRKRAKS